MTKKETDEKEKLIREKKAYRKIRLISFFITFLIIVCAIGISYFLISRLGR